MPLLDLDRGGRGYRCLGRRRRCCFERLDGLHRLCGGIRKFWGKRSGDGGGKYPATAKPELNWVRRRGVSIVPAMPPFPISVNTATFARHRRGELPTAMKRPLYEAGSGSQS